MYLHEMNMNMYEGHNKYKMTYEYLSYGTLHQKKNRRTMLLVIFPRRVPRNSSSL